MTPALLPLIVFSPVLIYAGLSDLRRLRIPNWTSHTALVLFILTVPLIGLSEAGLRIAVAGTVFAIGLGLWLFRLFGAGDVKLLSALLLLVPLADLQLFWQVFAVSMLVGVGAVSGLRATGAMRLSGWLSMRAAGAFPMGVSIALAGITLPAASFLLS